jgi:hypothetical protein
MSQLLMLHLVQYRLVRSGVLTALLVGGGEKVSYLLKPSWNVMARGDPREGKWRGNWRMEWVASTLHTTSKHGVFCVTTADAHTSAASSRLNWRPCRFNGLVCSAERRNLVSARVPSHFKRSLLRLYSVGGNVWRSCGMILTGKSDVVQENNVSVLNYSQ